MSNKEKQLHCRYLCVYYNLICFSYLNNTLSTTELHSFGVWEWGVTNLRMKLLRSILRHFLGSFLRNVQESQNMGRLRRNYKQNSNPKPVKYESNFLTSTIRSQLQHFSFSNSKKERTFYGTHIIKKYEWYTGLWNFVREESRTFFNKWLVYSNNEAVITG